MPRIGERGWIHSGVKVYDNAVAPMAWTDLNLSSVIGKNRALVFLKFKNRYNELSNVIHLRSNGDTANVATSSVFAGANNIVMISHGYIAHLVMETDENGIVEWKADDPDETDIWILGYIR